MIDKIVFSTQNTDDSDKDLQPGEFRDARNVISFSENRNGWRKKNIAGTKNIATFTVSELAVCVGSKYNRPTNKAYFIFDDPSFGDCIIEYDVNINVSTLLVRNSGFNFDAKFPVTDIDIAGDLLYFNDALNGPRKINITKAKAGLYTGSNFSEVAIAQIKKQPIVPVVATRVTDSLRTTLNPAIRRASFQFALRYVYLDNEVTVISPVSRLIPINRDKSATNTNNAIQLILLIDADVKPFLDRVELIVRNGNTGNWFIYDKIAPSLFTTAAADPVTGYARFSLIYYFYNDKAGPVLSDEEALPLYQSFPRLSASEEFFKDRLFDVDSKSEYDLEEDNWGASIQLTHAKDPADRAALIGLVTNKNPSPNSLLGLSRYGAGFVFFDEFGRRSGVSVKPGLFFETPANETYPSFGNQLVNALSSSITAVIQGTGKPPRWAHWLQPMRTNNLSYLWWHSTKCRVMFPKSLNKALSDTATTGYFLEDGYEYFDMNKRIKDILSGAASDFPVAFAPYIDIIVPDDFPFSIDDQVLIKPAFNHPDNSMTYTANWSLDQGQIIARFSNKIRIKNPINSVLKYKELYVQSAVRYSGVNLNPYTYPVNPANQALDNSEIFFHLSFFRPVDKQAEPVFWEVGELIPIQNPGTDDRAFPSTMPLHGDCFMQGYRFEEPGISYAGSTHSTDFVLTDTEDKQVVMYPSMSALTGEKGTTFKSGISTDQGKPNVEIDSTDEISQGNVVRYTDKYIANSKVNGLGVMRSANKYTLPLDRGNIIKLIGSNDNTILAIHARTMSSLYVEMRVLKSPSGEETITQSDDVIGFDRPVSGELGTINPESVVSVDNYRVYGFDINSAEPWRKSNDGLTPLATQYKTKKWFKAKCDALLLAKSIDPTLDIKVIGGFDPYLQVYFLTFKEVQYVVDSVTITIPSETVGFSELAKGWIGHVDFLPENYMNFGRSIVSVKNQKLWKHNEDQDNHNMFYDVQYNSEITFVSHMEDDKVKIWDWVGQATNSIWKVASITTPGGQLTDIGESLFKRKNGMFYADILRDVNTPAEMLPAGVSAKQFGVLMQSQTCTVTLRNSEKKEVILDAVYIGYSPASGHLIAPK